MFRRVHREEELRPMSLTILPQVLDKSQAKGSTRTLMAVIGYHANECCGLAWPSNATLQRELNLSERNTHYQVWRGQELGELVVHPGAGPKGRNLYQVRLSGVLMGAPSREAAHGRTHAPGCPWGPRGGAPDGRGRGAPVRRSEGAPPGTHNNKERQINDRRISPVAPAPDNREAIARRQAEDEEWRRRYDARYGEPPPKEEPMPKRRRPRGRPELRPEHARPRDPETFMRAFTAAMAATQQPHPRLHERVSPYVVLQDGADDVGIRLTDTPTNRAHLTLRDYYADQAAFASASWRFWALGPLLERPELAPWVIAQGAERWEVHDAVIAAAATAPLNAKGEFLLKPFCAAVQRWAEEHPDAPEPPPAP